MLLVFLLHLLNNNYCIGFALSQPESKLNTLTYFQILQTFYHLQCNFRLHLVSASLTTARYTASRYQLYERVNFSCWESCMLWARITHICHIPVSASSCCSSIPVCAQNYPLIRHSARVKRTWGVVRCVLSTVPCHFSSTPTLQLSTQSKQEGLAVASIVRDDPSTLPGDDPSPLPSMHRDHNVR